MTHVRVNETVWCNTGNPSNEPDGSFVGTVISIDGDNYSIMQKKNLFGIKTVIAKAEQITTLYAQPISGEIRKFIEETLIKNSSKDYVSVGWIYGMEDDSDTDTLAYPVRYWIDGDYRLIIMKFSEDNAVFETVIKKINKHFNCNPDAQIVARYEVQGSCLDIEFFKLLDNDVQTNGISMNENLKITMIAINKWMFFGYNFEMVCYSYINGGKCEMKQLPKFIVKAKWTTGIDHIIAIWEEAVKCRRPSSYMSNFYTELDIADRKVLIEWVMSNFDCEHQIIMENR